MREDEETMFDRVHDDFGRDLLMAMGCAWTVDVWGQGAMCLARNKALDFTAHFPTSGSPSSTVALLLLHP
jgi:hypothetical protein